MKINRHKKGAAWTYDDPREHAAVFEALVWLGFDMSVFDDWLEGPGWTEEARMNAFVLRQRFFDAHRAGNTDAVEAWGLLLAQTQRMNLRQAFLHPHAAKGVKFQPKRAAGTVNPVRNTASLSFESDLLCRSPNWTEAAR